MNKENNFQYCIFSYQKEIWGNLNDFLFQERSQHKIFDAFLKPKFTNPKHYCFSKNFIIQSCWVEQKCESEQFRSLNKETHQFVISEVSLIQTTSWPGKWEILTYAFWTQQTTNNCFCWNRTWLSEGEPSSETSKLKGFGWRDFTWDYVIRLWRWYPKLEKWYLKKKCKVPIQQDPWIPCYHHK